MGEIATIDPLLSLQVGHDLSIMRNLRVGTNNYLEKYENPEIWQELYLKTGELKYKELISELKKSVLKIAKRKGFLFWFRTWFYFRGEKLELTELGKMMKQADKTLNSLNTMHDANIKTNNEPTN